MLYLVDCLIPKKGGMNLEINNTIKNIHRGGSGNEEHEPQLRQPPEAGLRYTGVIYTPAGVMGSSEMNQHIEITHKNGTTDF